MIFDRHKNKYFAKKTSDSDSKAENRRYYELVAMEKQGLIKDLQKQPLFVLQEGFKYKKGERNETSIKYTADFQYFDLEKKKIIVEEYKSPYTRRLADYSIRRRLFKYSIKDRFGEIEFIETVG